MARRRKSMFAILLGSPSRKRKSKGFFGTLLAGQAKTEKRNKMYPRRK